MSSKCIFQVKFISQLKLPVMGLVEKIILCLPISWRDRPIPLRSCSCRIRHVRTYDGNNKCVFQLQIFENEIFLLHIQSRHNIKTFCIGISRVKVERLYAFLIPVKSTFQIQFVEVLLSKTYAHMIEFCVIIVIVSSHLSVFRSR